MAFRRFAAAAVRHGWHWVLAADRLVRLHLAFFTATWMLLGAASVSRSLSATELMLLLATALCFHVYAYVLNDVVDLQIDRTQPTRQRDMLVSGVVTPRQGLLIALLQPLLTLPLTASLDGTLASHLTIGAGFVLMGAYNVWGKRCPFPPLMDAIQGLAWGSLALYAALALGTTPAPLTWIVAAYATLFTVFINGIHGGLRDLANDLASGARTTAIFLGARPAAAVGERLLPATLSSYAWWVLVALVLLNAVLMVRNDFNYGVAAWIAITSVVAAINVWAILLQPRVLRPSGSDDDIAWRLQMYIMLSALPIAFSAHASSGILAVLLLLNALALLLFDTTERVSRWAWSAMKSVRDRSRDQRRLPARISQVD